LLVRVVAEHKADQKGQRMPSALAP
jgi:hypothetical protein